VKKKWSDRVKNTWRGMFTTKVAGNASDPMFRP
jgi:hypothetical protein